MMPTVAKWTPDRLTLDRLYWLEEQSMERIASQYGVTGRAVGYWLEKFNIPVRRKGLRTDGLCIECGEPGCRIKRYYQNGRRPWTQTNRCAFHFHLHRRNWDRDRKRAEKRIGQRVSQGEPE